MEKDDELKGDGNSLTAEYWLYDSRLGRRWNIDPMHQFDSDYSTLGDNPISNIDPSGAWVPTDDGKQIVAESGDNLETLMSDFGFSKVDAMAMFANDGFQNDEQGNPIIKEGDRINVCNSFEKSIENSPGNYDDEHWLLEQQEDYNGPALYLDVPVEDNYNCWGSSITGTQEGEINNSCGITMGESFDQFLSVDYKPVSEKNAEFGKTIIRMEKDGEVTHGMVFYGKNRAGEIYVYTKNGWDIKPQIMKLKDVIKNHGDTYGDIKGKNIFQSGFYTIKKKSLQEAREYNKEYED